jgi:glycosyltransferase involved in cell wall biosynthesis
VIAISQHTKQEVVDLLRVPEERISVVYPGIDEVFMPLPPQRVEDFRRARLGARQYILYVGTLEPRKNIDVLIRAFGRARRALDLPHVLVMVGARGWQYESLFALAQDPAVRGAVRFEGYAGAEVLPLWYNGADLFVYPSAYEGLGLPVLEAMACGAPTITTSTSSLAEIAGDAAVVVESGSEEALEVAIRELLGNDEKRRRIRQAGLVRAGQFGWHRAATETVRVYERVGSQ